MAQVAASLATPFRYDNGQKPMQEAAINGHKGSADGLGDSLGTVVGR